MPNLSQLKRQHMLEFLDKIKEEHKTDDEMLIALGEIANALISKKYGLVWEQHEENVDVAMQTNIPVFTEVSEREISLVPNNRYNFLLEGDNLHSLYLLEKTHKGAIDLIYIDPPYNTGHEDFVYDDNYVAEEDSFRHSKWLSFMEKRLLIAKELLSEKGVIFIQISDIEVAQLKCSCDDIFGESNFLNIISVNMKNIAGASGGGEDKRFKKNCEYILVYAKSYDFLPLFNGAYTYTEMSFVLKPKTTVFHIPEQDFFKYDPNVKNEVEYLSNAYHDYTSGFATSVVRSTSEMLFEQHCEKREDIECVYKNGDSGQQYFSIVYIDGLRHQWLFYADYIVKKKDGTIWIIETKGGESKGKNKNIDDQIENKFNAFKDYAAQQGIQWGFVRDKDNQLYINNTVFSIDMSDDAWQPLENVF